MVQICSNRTLTNLAAGIAAFFCAINVSFFFTISILATAVVGNIAIGLQYQAALPPSVGAAVGCITLSAVSMPWLIAVMSSAIDWDRWPCRYVKLKASLCELFRVRAPESSLERGQNIRRLVWYTVPLDVWIISTIVGVNSDGNMGTSIFIVLSFIYVLLNATQDFVRLQSRPLRDSSMLFCLFGQQRGVFPVFALIATVLTTTSIVIQDKPMIQGGDGAIAVIYILAGFYICAHLAIWWRERKNNPNNSDDDEENNNESTTATATARTTKKKRLFIARSKETVILAASEMISLLVSGICIAVSYDSDNSIGVFVFLAVVSIVYGWLWIQDVVVNLADQKSDASNNGNGNNGNNSSYGAVAGHTEREVDFTTTRSMFQLHGDDDQQQQQQQHAALAGGINGTTTNHHREAQQQQQNSSSDALRSAASSSFNSPTDNQLARDDDSPAAAVPVPPEQGQQQNNNSSLASMNSAPSNTTTPPVVLVARPKATNANNSSKANAAANNDEKELPLVSRCSDMLFEDDSMNNNNNRRRLSSELNDGSVAANNDNGASERSIGQRTTVRRIAIVVLGTAVTMVMLASFINTLGNNRAVSCPGKFPGTNSSTDFERLTVCDVLFGGPRVNFSITDFTSLAAASYFTDEHFQEALEIYWPNENVSKIGEDKTHGAAVAVRFFSVVFPKRNTTVTVVRGSSTALDWLYDLAISSDAVSLQLGTALLPVFFGLALEATLVDIISRLKFGLRKYHVPVVEEVERLKLAYPGSEHYVCGHSLGAQTANLVGAISNTKSVTISPFGIAMQYKRFDFSLVTANEVVTALIPNGDLVPKFDVQVGSLQNFNQLEKCSGKNAMCHSIALSQRTLATNCGDPLGRLTVPVSHVGSPCP